MAVLGIIVFIGFIALGLVYIIGTNIQETAKKIDENLDHIKIYVLEARRNEKDFLLRDDEKYANNHKKYILKIKTILKSLKLIISKDQYNLIKTLEKTIQEYENAFNQVVKEKIELGLNEKKGLLGNLRNAVHNIENELKIHNMIQLSHSMLMMRRHEKDFLMRENDKYLKNMDIETKHFIELLAASNLKIDLKNKIRKQLDTYHKDFNNMAKHMKIVQKEKTHFRKAIHKLDPVLVKIDKSNKIYQDYIKNMINLIFIITIISVIISIIAFIYFFSRGIIKSLSRGVAIANKLAEGDLTEEINEIIYNDEMGQLLDSMKKMLQYLKKVVKEMSEISSNLAASSEQINAAANNLSEGASTQAASVEETSASTEELTAAIKQVSDHAISMRDKSNDSLKEAQEYKENINQVSEEMVNISVSTEKIGDIIKVINDIADQTNLLSLNAAIEAARAGEHGRGFAVVAEAISTLANRSAESTKEIENLIRVSIERINKGVSSVKDSTSSFDSIVSTIEENNKVVNEISKSMEEQHSGSGQIQKATEEINTITQSITASSEEMAGSTSELHNLAERLNSIVGTFKISKNGQKDTTNITLLNL